MYHVPLHSSLSPTTFCGMSHVVLAALKNWSPGHDRSEMTTVKSSPSLFLIVHSTYLRQSSGCSTRRGDVGGVEDEDDLHRAR